MTGVQTCALPISKKNAAWRADPERAKKWAETEKDGPLVNRVYNQLMEPTAYSQLDRGEAYGPDVATRKPYIFELREYQPRQTFSAAGLEVTAIQVPHYVIETYGFRISDGSRTLAYSGDSGPSDQLADLARDADLFLCEATLERGELDGEPRGHLDIDEALAAFAASGAKRLLVTHRPDELPLADGLERAYDGLELEV